MKLYGLSPHVTYARHKIRDIFVYLVAAVTPTLQCLTISLDSLAF